MKLLFENVSVCRFLDFIVSIILNVSLHYTLHFRFYIWILTVLAILESIISIKLKSTDSSIVNWKSFKEQWRRRKQYFHVSLIFLGVHLNLLWKFILKDKKVLVKIFDIYWDFGYVWPFDIGNNRASLRSENDRTT